LQRKRSNFLSIAQRLNVQKLSELSDPSESADIVETAEHVSLDNAIKLLYPEGSRTNSQIIRNIIVSLNLTPFDVQPDSTDGSQLKATALVTPSQYKCIQHLKERDIKKLTLSTHFEYAAIPAAGCMHINNLSNNTAFNEIMTLSPYRQILAFESYTQITEEHLELLNAHWRKRPWISMAFSQLLAGAVFVDGNQALFLNGVKSYNRYPSIDVHYEKVQRTQGSTIPDLTS
jgi:hypothetical protein